MEEFDIAYKQHKTIIPIAYPGMISDDIWKIVSGNLTTYPYLEGLINKLTSSEPVEVLSKTIIHILDSIQDNK